jgi:hypothetical protein
MKIWNWTDKPHAFRTSEIHISLKVLACASLICHGRAKGHDRQSDRSSRRVHSSFTNADTYTLARNGVHSIPSLCKGTVRSLSGKHIAHTSTEELEYTNANPAHGYFTCQKWYPLLAAKTIFKGFEFYSPSSVSRVTCFVGPCRSTKDRARGSIVTKPDCKIFRIQGPDALSTDR